MPGIRHVEQTLKYRVEPAVVAEALISTLETTGRVDSVQRETGVITGLMGDNWLGFIPVWDTPIYIQVAPIESGTEVTLKLSRTVGLLEDGVVQKRMARFLGLLAENPQLKGKSAGTGW